MVHLLRCSGRAARTDFGAVGTGRRVDNRTRPVPEDGPHFRVLFYPFIRLGAGWAVTPEEPVVDGEGWEPFMGGWGMPGAVGA